MPRIELFLDINPPSGTAQQRRISFRSGKIRTYLPKRIRDTKNVFVSYLRKHAPEHPLEGPLRVKQIWYYPMPKNRKKYNKRILPKITYGDVDNIAKMLNDACTAAGIWRDDRYVYSLTVEKYWVDSDKHPIGINIEICYETAELNDLLPMEVQ